MNYIRRIFIKIAKMSTGFRFGHFHQNNMLGWLIIAYISSCCITTLSLFGIYQIQIPEVIFLLLIPLGIRYIKDTRQVTKLDTILFIYLIIFLVNAIFHPNAKTLTEVLGTFYVVIMSHIFSRFLSFKNNFEIYLPKAIYGLFFTSVISGLAGYLLHITGITNYFGHFYGNYPYFGDVWRLDGLTWCNLLVSCIMLSLLFLHIFEKDHKKLVYYTITGILVCALTLSKEIVILITILVMLYVSKSYFVHYKKFFAFGSCSVALFVGFMTFFAVRDKNLTFNESSISNNSQIGEEILFSGEGYAFHGTTYFYLAKSAAELFTENKVKGIGSGQFYDKILERQKIGKYPASLTPYDTHGFYLGQLSELGIFYLLFLGLFLFESIQFLQNKLQLDKVHLLVLSSILIYFLISYMVGGSKHYRHFWVFLGILNSYYLNNTIGRAEKVLISSNT